MRQPGAGTSARVVVALVAVIALAGVVVAALVSRNQSIAAQGTGASAFQPTPLDTPLPLRRVLVLGDSYAVGTGASSTEQGFVRRLAVLQRWQVDDQAHGGTGYATTGSTGVLGCDTDDCPDYAGALSDVTGAAPDAVLVFGGRNDVGRSTSALQRAIPAFYRQLCTEYPDADVYAVSPVWDSRTPPAQLAVVQRLVRAAVSENCAKGVYVDIGEPLLGMRDLIVSDGVHPTDEGHAVLARAILRALDGAR